MTQSPSSPGAVCLGTAFGILLQKSTFSQTEGLLFVPASSPTLLLTFTRVFMSFFVALGSDDGVDLQCSVMTVPDVFRNGKNADHNGPYNGVLIGTQNCKP
jgi:hypothetical protein